MSSKKQQTTEFVTKDIPKSSIMGAFQKLGPRYMSKNPVAFMVEIGFFTTLLLCFIPNMFGDVGVAGDGFSVASLRAHSVIVTIILFITVLFISFAESVVERGGKAQAGTLKKTEKDTVAHLLMPDGSKTDIPTSESKKGDVTMVRMNEPIPDGDGAIEGIASVDESTTMGESALVTREVGGDFFSVIDGTTVVLDWLEIKIIAEPGSSFLDKMIALVEGVSRQKTPDEAILNTLLVGLAIIFLIVIVCLYPFVVYSGVQIPAATLIALMVCLTPITIEGPLPATGIAGMDHATRFNVTVMLGKAVEACGDMDTVMLDKTDTITFDNRLVADFRPMTGADQRELIDLAALPSLEGTAPEGKSIVELGRKMGNGIDLSVERSTGLIELTAQSKTLGVDLENGTRIRKETGEAIKAFASARGGKFPKDLDMIVEGISKLGGTPLIACRDNRILGVIYLKDTIKPGLVERFARLREIGIETIICTGDNPLTAATIAKEAGADDSIAEYKPEDKITGTKKEQTGGKIVTMTGDGTSDVPALAQADVGLAMNSGTQAAKETVNMVDLNSSPTEILEVAGIGKQLLITRESLTTLSITNDVAKYFAIMSAMFMLAIPQMNMLNIMKLITPYNAILSALIFNAIVTPSLILTAMRGVKYKPIRSDKMLLKSTGIYGVGDVIVPPMGIRIIDVMVSPLLALLGL